MARILSLHFSYHSGPELHFYGLPRTPRNSSGPNDEIKLGRKIEAALQGPFIIGFSVAKDVRLLIGSADFEVSLRRARTNDVLNFGDLIRAYKMNSCGRSLALWPEGALTIIGRAIGFVLWLTAKRVKTLGNYLGATAF